MQDVVYRIKKILEGVNNADLKNKDAGWSIKQIIGHLVDSASNNHQRFVRYSIGQALEFPAYEPDLFVERGHYSAFDTKCLIDLWYSYNIFIDHVVDNIPTEHLSSLIKVGEFPEITLEHLIRDYYDHLKQHEDQILRIINGQ